MTGPRRIALTGGIGMGKSTVGAMFADHGIPLFDADAEVHRLQGPGGALVAPIAAAFPGVCVDGAIDRSRLAPRVLGDPAALARLEALVHPAVAAARDAFVAAHRDAPAILFDIPLLFETGRAGDYEAVILVSAPAAVQRERVLKRPGMTQERFDAILARQATEADRRAGATHIIDTSGPLDQTRAQVDRLVACMRLVAAR